MATKGPEQTVETPVVGLVTEPSSPVTSPAEAAAEGGPLIEENILQVWQAELEGSRLPDRSGVPSGIPEDILYYSPGESLFPGQSMSPASPMSRGPSPRSANEEPPEAVEELPEAAEKLAAAATTNVVEEALELPITVPLPPPRVDIFERTVIPPSFGRTAQADPSVADRPPRTPYLVPDAEGLLQVTTEQVKTLVVAGTPFSEYVKEGKPLFRQPPVEVPPLPSTLPTDAGEQPPSPEARSDSPTPKVRRPSRLKVTKVKKSKGAGPSTAIAPSPAIARQPQPAGVGRPSSPPAGPSSRVRVDAALQRAINREEIAAAIPTFRYPFCSYQGRARVLYSRSPKITPNVALLAAPQEDILPLVITSADRSPIRVKWWDPRISPSQLKKGLIQLTPQESEWRKATFLNRRNLQRRTRPGYDVYATGYLVPKAAYMQRHTRKLGEQAAELMKLGHTVSDRQSPVRGVPGSPYRSPAESPSGSQDKSPERDGSPRGRSPSPCSPGRDGSPKGKSPSPGPQSVAAPVSRRKQPALKGQVSGPPRSPSPPPKRQRLLRGQGASGGDSPTVSPPRSPRPLVKTKPSEAGLPEKLKKAVAARPSSPARPSSSPQIKKKKVRSPSPPRSSSPPQKKKKAGLTPPASTVVATPAPAAAVGPPATTAPPAVAAVPITPTGIRRIPSTSSPATPTGILATTIFGRPLPSATIGRPGGTGPLPPLPMDSRSQMHFTLMGISLIRELIRHLDTDSAALSWFTDEENSLLSSYLRVRFRQGSGRLE